MLLLLVLLVLLVLWVLVWLLLLALVLAETKRMVPVGQREVWNAGEQREVWRSRTPSTTRVPLVA